MKTIEAMRAELTIAAPQILQSLDDTEGYTLEDYLDDLRRARPEDLETEYRRHRSVIEQDRARRLAGTLTELVSTGKV